MGAVVVRLNCETARERERDRERWWNKKYCNVNQKQKETHLNHPSSWVSLRVWRGFLLADSRESVFLHRSGWQPTCSQRVPTEHAASLARERGWNPGTFLREEWKLWFIQFINFYLNPMQSKPRSIARSRATPVPRRIVRQVTTLSCNQSKARLFAICEIQYCVLREITRIWIWNGFGMAALGNSIAFCRRSNGAGAVLPVSSWRKWSMFCTLSVSLRVFPTRRNWRCRLCTLSMVDETGKNDAGINPPRTDNDQNDWFRRLNGYSSGATSKCGLNALRFQRQPVPPPARKLGRLPFNFSICQTLCSSYCTHHTNWVSLC